MFSLHFEIIENVSFPVLSTTTDTFMVAIDEKGCAPFILSLLNTHEGLFITRVNEKLESSTNHFKIEKDYIFIKKSFKSLWAPCLLELKDFSYDSLLQSIRQN